jgi:hypothetical protein
MKASRRRSSSKGVVDAHLTSGARGQLTQTGIWSSEDGMCERAERSGGREARRNNGVRRVSAEPRVPLVGGS